MNLSEIVNVVITRETANVSQAGFGTLLIIGPAVNVNNRLEYFTDAASAIAKLIGTDTREEALITALFAQTPAPTRVALGAMQASVTAVFTGTYSAGAIAATVNGREITQAFDTDLDTTLTALAASIQADADVVTAAYTAGTNTLVITPATGKNAGVTFDLTAITGTMEVALTRTELSEAYDTALAAILVEQPDWYGIAAATQTISKQQLIATWAEANKKLFGAGSADANIIDQTLAGDSTSIAALIKAQALTKSFAVYSASAATEGVEAAVFGKMLPLNPGEYTVKFKTLAGITVDSLTSTQSTNARAKKANTYETVGGINIVAEGTVGSGEYIDVIVFIDWLYAEIQSSVYAQLVKVKKVAFTDAGITLIQSAIDKPLKIGQDRGGISPKAFDADNVQIGGYKIVMPTFASVSAADKSARTLQNATFTAWLAGAIHIVRVDGIVTL